MNTPSPQEGSGQYSQTPTAVNRQIQPAISTKSANNVDTVSALQSASPRTLLSVPWASEHDNLRYLGTTRITMENPQFVKAVSEISSMAEHHDMSDLSNH